MKILKKELYEKIKKLIYDANFILPDEKIKKIKQMEEGEKNANSKFTLNKIIENSDFAKKNQLPLCQDTGSAVFFVKIGFKVILEEPIKFTIEKAVKDAYEEFFLRKSIVNDPIFERKNTKNNLPAIIHFEQIKENKLEIDFLPKGGGAENKSILKMLKPSDGQEGVIKETLEACKKAGSSSCPPWVIGIGIGGSFDSVSHLAKKALIRKLGDFNANSKFASLEKEMANKIESLNIGPMGFGGNTLINLAIEYFPCHMASLPFAINFQCHSARNHKITFV